MELAGDHLMCDIARNLAPGDRTTEIFGFGATTSSVLPSGRRAGYFTASGSQWNLTPTNRNSQTAPYRAQNKTQQP